MTSKLIFCFGVFPILFFPSGPAISGSADVCLLDEKKCMAEFPEICLSWKKNYSDVCLTDSGDNFFGFIENQKELPEFYKLDAGSGRIYRGFIFLGNHGTGSSERIFFGWSSKLSRTVDLALLHSFTETDDSPYVRYKLAFSVGSCAQGVELRWRYEARGAFTLCGVESQWSFCDFNSIPKVFVCAREGEYIEHAVSQCAGAGDRFRSRISLDKNEFSECEKHEEYEE